MNRHARRSAFTLVEVVIVLAIIAVISAIAIPRFGTGSRRYRLESAANRVVADIKLARQRAIQTSSQQMMVFNLDSNSYSLPGVDSLDDASRTYSVELDEPPYETSILAIDFDGGSMLTFDGYGDPVSEDGGIGQVWLVTGSMGMRVQFDLDTGEISIQ